MEKLLEDYIENKIDSYEKTWKGDYIVYYTKFSLPLTKAVSLEDLLVFIYNKK